LEHDDDSTISSATLLKARQRDNDAWSSIWKQYSPRVFRQALRLGISESDAEDITVEVFRKVWSRLDHFSRDDSGQSLGAWINRITQTTALDHLKRVCRVPEGLGAAAIQVPDRSGKQTDAGLSPLWLAFWQAEGIVENQCSQRAWECFRLARIAHLPHSEIACILGMSVTNVSTTANRVFERIREQCLRQLELANFTIDQEGRLVPRDSADQ
jgi:DNA-directed RNA polymerase specialized sigma24 family protein